MKNSCLLTACLSTVLISSGALADDRPDHFSGATAATMEEALSHFAETNRQVAEVLTRDEITPGDMARIHELTYTLENALERIDDEYDQLEDQLEALHKASEGADAQRARELGNAYLENAQRFPR